MNIASKDARSTGANETAYEATTQMAWNFDYTGKVPKVEDLYQRAKENQWNADDLTWDTPIDPSNPIVTSANSDYARMPFFGRLSQSQRETFTAHSTAQMLSQFLHGEQGALMTAATLTHSMPDTMAKFYAATQTMDEARHVEVYARYIDKLAISYPMVAWLKNLVDVTLSSNDCHKVMIGMNMVIEGLALGAFNNMYRQTNEPLLKSLTFNVMRDESRHVSFGHVYLAPTVAAMHKDDREDLADFAFSAVKILVEGQNGPMEPGFLSVLEQSGIDPEDFAAGMQEAAEQGIQNELPPGQVHSLKDLMMPALLRAGLVTPRSKELYEKLGVPVNVDLSVLEAMEDRGSSTNVLNAEAADY